MKMQTHYHIPSEYQKFGRIRKYHKIRKIIDIALKVIPIVKISLPLIRKILEIFLTGNGKNNNN